MLYVGDVLHDKNDHNPIEDVKPVNGASWMLELAQHIRSTEMKTPMAHRRDPRLADSRTGAEILRREHLGRSSMWRDLFIDLISRSPIARWAPIPLRLIVGYGFMQHGFAKLARGPDAFPAILHAIG